MAWRCHAAKKRERHLKKAGHHVLELLHLPVARAQRALERRHTLIPRLHTNLICHLTPVPWWLEHSWSEDVARVRISKLVVHQDISVIWISPVVA